MKNSETEIVKKMQKPPIIKNFKNNKNSKNNALNEKDVKENSDIMIKIFKTKQPSNSDNEENLSSSEQEDEMYTDIDDSQSEEEISDNSSSSFETDSDSESAEQNSDEIGDITLKRYINSQVDGIINDVDENIDEEEGFEYDEDNEGEDVVDDDDDDDDDDEAYDEGCLDDFLNEISYNYMLSDELYSNEIYSDLDQDEPSYTDVVITEMNDDIIKEVESWQENDAKSEEDCNEAVN
ncbi:uncharacterized protein [Rhodnius prolixus]|uniref:uncharacterized protein n=1 Tax=Rhodnius prolixus TaxID=13249 RepID=UPI003D18EC50